METSTYPFSANVVASSTTSPSDLSPQQKDPPWTQTMAGRLVTVSPVGWYISISRGTV